MESNYEIEFRSISTGVICPICQKKYAVKLSVDYLSQHQGQEIACVFAAVAPGKK